MDGAAWAGLGTIVTAMAGGVAAVIAALAKRRTDAETNDETTARRFQEERAALVAEYRGLLDELRRHHAEIEKRHAEETRRIETRVERVEADLREAREGHRSCEENLSIERSARAELERRLRRAEARLSELEEP